MYYKTNYSSPLGNIILASSEVGLMGLWFEGQKYEGKTLPKENIVEDDKHPVLLQAERWLEDYFNNLKPKIQSLKLDPLGTKFQRDVWEILIRIPYGKVVTYKAVAQEIARQYGIEKMSAQAVGGAVGHNQISIIIPCHRVVGVGGSLRGYAGGLDKKIKLLEHERADVTNNNFALKTNDFL